MVFVEFESFDDTDSDWPYVLILEFDDIGSDWYILDLGLFALVELGCLPLFVGSDLVISRFANVGVIGICMTLELGESSPNEWNWAAWEEFMESASW